MQIRVAELSGFLLAKASAARERRAPKDWYDIAFVLLHNNLRGPTVAGQRTRELFSRELEGGPIRTALDDLLANFEVPAAQGPVAYEVRCRLITRTLTKRRFVPMRSPLCASSIPL